MAAAAFSPYERVRDSSGSRGTVRYVGPVATSKNASTAWVGVEWDDATRGKHDGAVEKDGVETRYFRCPAGAGSFVKPSKLSRGERFLSALKERYQKTDGPAADELYVPTMRGNKVAIELKESARVTRRQQIDRNGLGAARVSTPQLLRHICVTEGRGALLNGLRTQRQSIAKLQRIFINARLA